MALSNAELLHELVEVSFDSGYYAGRRAAISGNVDECKRQDKLRGAAIDRREVLRGEVLARMGIGSIKEFSDDLAGVAREALEALHIEGGDE